MSQNVYVLATIDDKHLIGVFNEESLAKQCARDINNVNFKKIYFTISCVPLDIYVNQGYPTYEI